jgi:hypothetical protein
MSVTGIEAETIINYNQDEKTAEIYTHDKRLIKRLLECCKKFPTLFYFVESEGEASTFLIPKKYVSVRQPKIYTEEQKERMSASGQRLQTLKR